MSLFWGPEAQLWNTERKRFHVLKWRVVRRDALRDKVSSSISLGADAKHVSSYGSQFLGKTTHNPQTVLLVAIKVDSAGPEARRGVVEFCSCSAG